MPKMWEVLKASKGLPVDDPIAALWGRKIAEGWEWQITEITGTLPMLFISDGAALTGYRIYGTAAGAGVETENLFDINGATSLIYNGVSIANNSIYIASIGSGATSRVYFEKEYPSGTYTITAKFNGDITNLRFFSPTQFQGGNYNQYYGGYFAEINDLLTVTFTEPFTIGIIAVGQAGKSGAIYDIMFDLGSTAHTSYIPHGYKLPLTVKGEKTENLAPPLSEWGNGYVSASGSIGPVSDVYKERYSPVISVEPNATYQWAYEAGQFPTGASEAWSGIGWYDKSGNFISRNSGVVNTVLEVVAPVNAAYARLSFSTYGEDHNAMFIKSSTPPDHYIPHRYTTDIPIYIGDSKLGANDFVNYVDQKIYTNVSTLTVTGNEEEWSYYGNFGGHQLFFFNVSDPSFLDDFKYLYCNKYTPTDDVSVTTVGGSKNQIIRYQRYGEKWNIRIIYIADDRFTSLQSFKSHLQTLYSAGDPLIISYQTATTDVTDPPVPLPPIPTYEGENTLSSTETLGEVTVKGRLSPSRWPLTNLIFHRYDVFYPELEDASRIAVSETFYLDVGAYILHQEVITFPEPVVVIQTEGFTGGIFPSFDGYWHIDTPGLYRFQVNKSNVLDPWNAAELEELGRTSTINKV